MSRYIDTDKLINDLDKMCREYTQEKSTFHPHIDFVFETINRQPTADVRENVKGEWIDEPVYKQTMDGNTWDGFTYCSECKEMHEYGYRSKYCPNCGAQMTARGEA